MPQESVENKLCTIISKEDNDQIFQLLGVRCQSLATTVIQLYVTESPHHMQWVKRDTGILCFVKDNFRKNYFFRLYCLKRGSMIWEQEIYNNMEYLAPSEFMHTFEGEGSMVAFNFASIGEAKELKTVVERKLLAKKRREERKSQRISLNAPTEQITPRLPTSNDINMYKKMSDPVERKAKRKRNITKADIGPPSEFRHVSHVGWDPDKGFDINCDDPQLNTFFQKAGVSEKQLQDKDTREFIYDFINKHGGREAIQEEVQKTRKPAPAPPSPVTGPPVPPRGAGRPHNRAAPPPPPSTTSQVPRPPPTPKNIPQGNAIPPPPPGAAPPPPPPPPPMGIPSPPVLPNDIPTAPMPAAAPDARSALMESIRGGTTLKPVDVERKPSDNARGDLMSEIRKGFQLKPANEREVKPVSPPAEKGRGDLAGALARALAERNRVIHSEDDSTSDTDSNDDEWDA